MPSNSLPELQPAPVPSSNVPPPKRRKRRRRELKGWRLTVVCVLFAAPFSIMALAMLDPWLPQIHHAISTAELVFQLTLAVGLIAGVSWLCRD